MVVIFEVPRVHCESCGLIRQVEVGFADERRNVKLCLTRFGHQASLIYALAAGSHGVAPEVAQLRRENLELRQQAGYRRSQHAVAKQQIAALEQEVAQLRGENRKLQDQLFGRKLETSSPTDRSNHLDEPDETAPPQPRGSGTTAPVPNAAIIAICRSAKNPGYCPSCSVHARPADDP